MVSISVPAFEDSNLELLWAPLRGLMLNSTVSSTYFLSIR